MAKSVADLLSEREGTRLDFKQDLAVREVLNNAVAHADYAVEGASIFVALFSDRLEVVLRPYPSSDMSARPVTGGVRTGRQQPNQPQTAEDRHAAVLAAIDELERPNTDDVQLQTGISKRSLGRDLRSLREKGLIEFVGAPQTGFYRRT
jgi:predicted HTH transcriptional regulator